ncbi:MAG: GGDEF and EAL domain-containing protein [Oscillospiraceae bacterium]|nr:GGDEF and EAL domain-containing protein [Oscillospiraceae bacterium]
MNEKRKKKLDELFRVFSAIADSNYVYLCDMQENYSRWSKKAVDFFDLPSEYMYNAGQIWEAYIHPDDRENYHRSIDAIFSGEDSGHKMQYRAKARDGSYAVCTCRGFVISDDDGNPEYFGGAIKNHDVINYIDNMTGLRSLYGFFDDLKTMFWKHEKNVILLVGINGFSNINDIYGYRFGNSILRKLGRLLTEIFADSGEVYRMDGTKFAVISPDLSPEKVSMMYKKLKDQVAHDFYAQGEHISLSLNAGIVNVDNFDISNETVYSCLKYAYYKSKNHRLGEPIVYVDDLNDTNRTMIEKLNVVRNSVSENCKGFYLCYQPIMDAGTEKLKGMEALIRWKNDFYGIIPPVQFIPILEQDPLFPELGKWILRQAMEDGKKMLQKYPNFVMNVNLSYAQLEQSNFADIVLDLLRETGFPAKNLCLEVTERCRLLDMNLLKAMFRKFREHGIRIALDDFGTGFASLGILRELPVDIIKIDREYVKNVENSTPDQHTVKFISDLADAFSAEVCVEGVETAEMRDFLKRYEISSLQGYFYSKPITVDQFVEKYVSNASDSAQSA